MLNLRQNCGVGNRILNVSLGMPIIVISICKKTCSLMMDWYRCYGRNIIVPERERSGRIEVNVWQWSYKIMVQIWYIIT